MRVVFLTHNYPRFAGDVSGAFLATLAGALVRRGIEVRVVAPSDRGQGGEDQLDGVSVRRVRYASAAERPPACARWLVCGGRSAGRPRRSWMPART